MTTEEIVEAIKLASNGSFIGDHCISTLMGWIPNYDKKGRPLNCDPNYKDSEFVIEGQTYKVTRHGWMVIIWEGDGRYTKLLGGIPDKGILAKIDLTPDYVKEYKEKI